MTTPGPGPADPTHDAAGGAAAAFAAAAAVALLSLAAAAGALALASARASLGGGALPLGLLLGALVALGAAFVALVGREALEHVRDARRPDTDDPERQELLHAGADLSPTDLAALASRSPRERARALDRLALLGHPASFAALERAALHPDPATARRALLSLARARARVRSDDDEIVASMIASIEAARAGRGTAEAALLLLERNARPVVERMLDPATREPRHDAALEALGKLRLHELAPLAGPWLRDRDPEIRAAAARALARLRRVPPGLDSDLLDLLSDGAWFVRAQAATALASATEDAACDPREEPVAQALTRSLGDPSWWVRRSAAASLAARGPVSRAALARAAATHGDPYARDAARGALEDPS